MPSEDNDTLGQTELEKNRISFLLACYEVAEGQISERFNMFTTGEKLEYNKKKTQKICDYLKGEGLIAYKTLDGGISLTHTGLKLAETILFAERSDSQSKPEVLFQSDESKDFGASPFGSSTFGSKSNENASQKDTHSGSNTYNQSDPKLLSKIEPMALHDATIPIERDSLGHQLYAEAIIDFIRNPLTKTPFTIAITGQWGSGKSTLMKWIKTSLMQDDNGYTTTWFSAWRHNHHEAIWAAFARKIVEDTITPWLRIRLRWRRFRDAIPSKGIWISCFIITALILAILWNLQPDSFQHQRSIWVALAVSALPWIRPIWKFCRSPLLQLVASSKGPDYDSKLGFQDEFEKDFKRLVDMVASVEKPLVIFIDDLDRAPPPIPVEVIEAMNILIGHSMCIFIIGLDINMVSASIEAKYLPVINRLNEDPNNSNRFTGRDFIEKLVQLSFEIPTPTGKQIKDYLSSLLNNDENTTSIVQPGLKNIIKEKILSDIEKSEAIQSFNDSPDVIYTIESLIEYIPRNPRKIKRFINSFRFLTFIAIRRGLIEKPDSSLQHLGAITVAALEYPTIYKLLQQKDAKKKLREIIDAFVNKKYEGAIHGINMDQLEDNNLQDLLITLEAVENLGTYLSLSSIIEPT